MCFETLIYFKVFELIFLDQICKNYKSKLSDIGEFPEFRIIWSYFLILTILGCHGKSLICRSHSARLALVKFSMQNTRKI